MFLSGRIPASLAHWLICFNSPCLSCSTVRHFASPLAKSWNETVVIFTVTCGMSLSLLRETRVCSWYTLKKAGHVLYPALFDVCLVVDLAVVELSTLGHCQSLDGGFLDLVIQDQAQARTKKRKLP